MTASGCVIGNKKVLPKAMRSVVQKAIKSVVEKETRQRLSHYQLRGLGNINKGLRGANFRGEQNS